MIRKSNEYQGSHQKDESQYRESNYCYKLLPLLLIFECLLRIYAFLFKLLLLFILLTLTILLYYRCCFLILA